jgi:hypothetical protein
MRIFIVLAAIAAGLIWGAYVLLIQVGLISEGCPAVSSRGGQIVIENNLAVDLGVRLHDATQTDMRIGAGQCVLVNIVRLQVAAETWEMGKEGAPNCVANLLPAQKLVLYERGGLVYCDIGRAEISME